MKYLNSLVFGVALLAAHNSVFADIYKTTDAEGNTVFTDSPDEPGASRVELRETNTADAPPPAPEMGDTAPDTSDNQAQHAPPGTPTYQDPNAGLYEERERRIREEESRDPSTRHEVRDAEPRHEVRDAEPRHEVRDAEPRHEVGD
jgi:hypothetical protein